MFVDTKMGSISPSGQLVSTIYQLTAVSILTTVLASMTRKICKTQEAIIVWCCLIKRTRILQVLPKRTDLVTILIVGMGKLVDVVHQQCLMVTAGGSQLVNARGKFQ